MNVSTSIANVGQTMCAYETLRRAKNLTRHT
jgi:hypothetical protein